jgi:hypothetical protein
MGSGSSSASSGCTTHSSAVNCTPQEKPIDTIKVAVAPDGRRLIVRVLAKQLTNVKTADQDENG